MPEAATRTRISSPRGLLRATLSNESGSLGMRAIAAVALMGNASKADTPTFIISSPVEYYLTVTHGNGSY
jgi:hypothetical protein